MVALPLFAQAALGGSIVSWAIIIVAVAAIVALVMIACRKFGITVPEWVVQTFWVIVVAAVIIGAIFLVARLAGLS